MTSCIWDALGGMLGATIIFADICIDPIGVLGNLTDIVDPLTTISKLCPSNAICLFGA